MIEYDPITHHIQRKIIEVLMLTSVARFRDLRPARVDTNLFTYHLKALIKEGLIEKTEGGYQLSREGLAYVDRVSESHKRVRTQPKIITMLLVQNSDGDVLLQRRRKQPYIDAWTLPYGKLHIDDASLEQAAKRETEEKIGLKDQSVIHAGDCYIRVRMNDEILSTTLAHVFRFDSDDIQTTEDLIWARPHKLGQHHLAPAVEQIVARGFFKDPFFFEEFEVDWTHR